MKHLRHGTLLVALVGLVGVAAAAPQPQSRKSIEPKAEQTLRQMADYMAGLKSFTVHSAAVDEVVLTSGQKLQLASESKVSVERPNRLLSEQLGGASGLAFYYDGKTMTLACKANNSYATAPAPTTLDATIDKARKQFQIEAPGADLLYSRPYEILTEQVTGGKFIGREVIDGVATNHLAFEGEEVDWQIWIQEGSQPLPLRFVIVSKTVKGQPEFAVTLSDWDTRANIDDSTFAFQPAAGAKPVQALASCGPVRAKGE
jgi:hypothetical protein